MDVAAPIGLILVQVTAILSAALLVQLALVRSAAARHAVLLGGLSWSASAHCWVWRCESFGTAPLMVVPARFIEPLSPVRLQTIAVGSTGQAAPAANSVSIQMVLGAIWLAGTIVARSFGWAMDCMPPAASDAQGSPFPASGSAAWPSKWRPRSGAGRRKSAATDRATVPIAVGLLRPVVLVPRGLAEQLSDRQLLEVLVHESAHAIRHDPLVGLFGRLLTAVLWFHPLVHLAIDLLGRAREDLCDNYALRSSFTNGLFASAPGDRRPRSSDASAVPGNRLFRSASQLRQRVVGLLNPRRNPATNLRLWKSAPRSVFRSPPAGAEPGLPGRYRASCNRAPGRS